MASQLCWVLPIDGVSKYEGGYQFQHMCSESGNDFLVSPGMEVTFYASQDFELIFECNPGDTVLETCYDGSTITVKTCQNYRWASSGSQHKKEGIQSQNRYSLGGQLSI